MVTVNLEFKIQIDTKKKKDRLETSRTCHRIQVRHKAPVFPQISCFEQSTLLGT